MPRRNLTILGINPGTRYFALAVLEGTDLTDWRIKILEGDFGTRRLPTALKIVARYAEEYHPSAIAMKIVHPSRSSSNLVEMVAKIRSLAQERGISLCSYRIGDLERFFEPHARINRARLAELVASSNPILRPELDRETKIKNRYYGRMFEAVAAASACFYQLERQGTYVKQQIKDSRH